MLPEKEGFIKKLEVPESVCQNPDVIQVSLNPELNGRVSLPPNDFDYLAWVTVKGSTKKSADKLLEQVISQIKIIIE